MATFHVLDARTSPSWSTIQGQPLSLNNVMRYVYFLAMFFTYIQGRFV
jgi:hypothetical protein